MEEISVGELMDKDPAAVLSTQLQKRKIVKRFDTCIILHAYYPETCEKILSGLLTLDKQFDLIITIPYGADISEHTITTRFPAAQIYLCENRGRDILPFLTLLPEILKLEYRYACKIHTKQDTGSSLGFDWCRDMLDKMLGSQDIVSKIKEAMDHHPDCGIVAPKGYVVPKNVYWQDNAEKIIRLARFCGMPMDDRNFYYVAGTMFWFRPQVFSLLANRRIQHKDFEEEQGQTNGTIFHAYERLFGIVATYAGCRIAESDGREIRESEASPMLNVLAQDLENHKQVVREVSAQISRFDRTLSERDGQIANLNQIVVERGEWASRLDSELKETKNQLNQIISGNSWKLTRPFREARRWLTAPGTQMKRYLQDRETGKFKAVRRLAGLVVSHPGTVIRLMRPHTIRKALAYLANNSWSLKKLIDRGEWLYLRQGQEAQKMIEAVCHPLISLYGLPKSSEAVSPSPPTDDDVRNWGESLMELTGSLPQESSASSVSIIIPVHDQIRFTLACLHSIFIQKTNFAYEIIIADDGSGDQTSDVFQNQFPRVRYVRNPKNLGFLRNCNAATRNASGEYLIFLNNDTLVCPDWLDELIRTFEENPGIGLVGSKLIYPDGTLQEAGGVIFDDGSGWNYGRFEDAALPQFNYLRDVDYCSGASIAISAKLWRQLGGFDERFAPAYYEDTDLAFRVREAGYRVVNQPLSAVVHFEGISNGRSESSGIKKYQFINKEKFYARWKKELNTYGACNPEALPADRLVRGRVLIIDAVTPMPDRDSGAMDIYQYMKILKSLDFHVTFVPENAVYFDEYTRNLQRQGIECLHLPWIKSPQHAIERYAPRADIIMLCRVNVAAPLVDLVKRKAARARILFDTVDLHFLREERQAELTGSSSLSARAMKTRTLELDVIDKVDATILRSPYELDLLKKIKPEARFFHFPITREIPGPAPTAWEDRKDIVFIGGFAHPPNTDAVKYFVRDIWPLLRRAGFSHRFVIVGSNVSDEIKSLEADDIIVRGFVKDLSDVFGQCLLSVAPLRYGAGMKGKVVTSLSYGVPCVATKIAAEGSGLVHLENIIVTEEADEMAKMIQDVCSNRQLWERISRSGLAYCENAFSLEATKKIIDETFSEILNIK